MCKSYLVYFFFSEIMAFINRYFCLIVFYPYFSQHLELSTTDIENLYSQKKACYSTERTTVFRFIREPPGVFNLYSFKGVFVNFRSCVFPELRVS